MKYLITLLVVGLLTGCAISNIHNRIYDKTDPITGKQTRTYLIELDNSNGNSFILAMGGSVGGRINITCGNNKINRVSIDPTSRLANGWLQIKFDNEKHYIIQGTNKYPYDLQYMYNTDAIKFVNNVIKYEKAIMKVGTHKGYTVMTANFKNLPKSDMKQKCFNINN